MALNSPAPGHRGRPEQPRPITAPPRRPGAYLLADVLTQGYLIVVALLIVARRGATVDHWPLFVAGHAITVLAVHGLIRAEPRGRGRPAFEFIRHFYPMLLYGPFFWETAKLNHLWVSGFLDPWFIRADDWLFGFQPGVEFMARWPYPGFSEVLYASYFSYYLMISGLALALYVRGRAEFRHYLTISCLVFYCCYLCYIVLPVVGPLIFYRPLPGYSLPAGLSPTPLPPIPAALQGGPFFRLMDILYVPFEAPGASFPSSHVAIALVTVYFSFRYLRAIRWPHLVLALLLCLSTVYGGYHYAVDVLAGAACAAVLIPLGNRLYARWGGPAPAA